MAWGTRTIGTSEIARAQGQARRAARIEARGGAVSCILEAESVPALRNAGVVLHEAATAADGTVIMLLVRDERDALLARALLGEGPGATLLRLLGRDDASWEAAHARVAKARRRTPAPFTPEAELATLARTAVVERDRALAGASTPNEAPIP